MLTNTARLGPYEILAPLGAGGMGEVYRARDTRLSRDVAIKVLPTELAGGPDRLKRFEREARAASSLNHPNVVTIYEIGESGGASYIAMELVEGRTLRSLLADGPIATKRLLAIAAQIADALGRAHGAGIVHRDLKPENVMITDGGLVKILDFGLAKLSEPLGPTSDTKSPTASAGTAAGVLLGTVGYMSPEQARGDPADFRSDQFSLGAVLYELATGRRAFARGSGVQTLAAVIEDEPEPIAALSPKTPALFRWIVERCLAKDPMERYSSTEDLAKQLADLRDHSKEPVGRFVSARTRGLFARRRVVPATVAAALVLAAAAAVWLWKGRGRGPEGAAASVLVPKRVVVAVFENLTGDPSLDPVGRMASDWITDGLSRAGIEVIPSSYAAEVAKPLTTGLTLAEVTGSGILVSGEYYLKGSTLQLQAKITDAVSHKLLLAVEPAEAPRASPSDAVETVRQRVRESLAVRLLPSEALSSTASAYEGKPPRFEAYAEMLLGEEASFRGDMEKSWAHERRAIELDPDFVEPYVWLIEDPVSKGDYPEAFRLLGLAQERRGRLSPLGRLDLDAGAAWVSHRHEEAVIAERELVRLAPGDLFAKFLLAQYLMVANRPREAVQVLTQPARWEIFLNPTLPLRGRIYFGVLTNALAVLGEHERELAEARRGRALYPDIGYIRAMEASALAALGRFDDLETAVQESLGQPLRMGGAEAVMLASAVELRARGHGKESVAMARRAVAWIRALPDENDPRKKGDVFADCLLYAEEWDESEKLHARLAAESAGKREEIWFRGTLGVLAAIKGDREKVQKISEELTRLRKPYLFGDDTFQRARIAAQLGEKERAIELLRFAISEGLKFGDVVSCPRAFEEELALDSLRGYPPFQDLMKPKG